MNTRLNWTLVLLAVASSTSVFAECGDTSDATYKDLEAAVAAPTTAESGTPATSGVIQGDVTPTNRPSPVPTHTN